MKKALFKELVESMKQAGEIARKERNASRVFEVTPETIKKLRSKTRK